MGGIADWCPGEPSCCSSACTKAAGRRTIDSRPHAALYCTILESAWKSHAPLDAAPECRMDADEWHRVLRPPPPESWAGPSVACRSAVSSLSGRSEWLAPAAGRVDLRRVIVCR